MVVQVTFIHSSIHTFMHPHIDTFIHSHIQAYTTHTYTHNINSHMITSVAQSLVWSYLINSAINSSKWLVLHNGQLEVYFCLPSGKSYITNSLRFIFCLPSGKSYITDNLDLFSIFQVVSPT